MATVSACAVVSRMTIPSTSWEPGERVRSSHQQGLLLLRLESGSDQTARQVSRLVVAVGLPLDSLAAGREPGDLARDEGVECFAPRSVSAGAAMKPRSGSRRASSGTVSVGVPSEPRPALTRTSESNNDRRAERSRARAVAQEIQLRSWS